MASMIVLAKSGDIISHNFNTRDVVCSAYDTKTNDQVGVQFTIIDENNVRVIWNSDDKLEIVIKS